MLTLNAEQEKVVVAAKGQKLAVMELAQSGQRVLSAAHSSEFTDMNIVKLEVERNIFYTAVCNHSHDLSEFLVHTGLQGRALGAYIGHLVQHCMPQVWAHLTGMPGSPCEQHLFGQPGQHDHDGSAGESQPPASCCITGLYAACGIMSAHKSEPHCIIWYHQTVLTLATMYAARLCCCLLVPCHIHSVCRSLGRHDGWRGDQHPYHRSLDGL